MEIPKFVSLNGIGLRLRGNSYWRDGGEYEVGYKVIDGVLLSWSWGLGNTQLHRIPLIKISEEEWRKSNGVYATN